MSNLREEGNNKQVGEHTIEKCENQTGAIYFIKVNEQALKSHVPLLKASDVLALAGLNPTVYALVKHFDNDHAETLESDQIIDLNNYGVEQFKTKKILVEVFYRDQSFLVRAGETKVKELKKIFGIPQANHLAILTENELKPLNDDGIVNLKGGEHFVAYPCDGKAS